jgi:hypothetical protein
MEYSEILKDPKWQKKRLQILERDKWKCCFCGDSESTLHVHHIVYAGKPWDQRDATYLTLCEKCHEEESKPYVKRGMKNSSDQELFFHIMQMHLRISRNNMIGIAGILSKIDVNYNSDLSIEDKLLFISSAIKKFRNKK